MARKKKTESPRAVVADLPHGPFVAEVARPPVAWNNRAGLRTANVETEDGELRIYFFEGYECSGSIKVDGAHDLDIPHHVGRIVRAALVLFDASRPTRCGFGPLAGVFVDGVPVVGGTGS